MSLTTDMSNPALSPEAIASRELLRLMVQRAIFCPSSGKLLDVRTAVLIEGTRGDGSEMTPMIAHPEAVEAAGGEAGLREALRAASPDAVITFTRGGRLMRSWRESAMVGAVLLLAAVACAFRAGELIERDRHAPDPATLTREALRDACNGENLSYREDEVAVYTFVGDPGNGDLCARVPKDLIVYE